MSTVAWFATDREIVVIENDGAIKEKVPIQIAADASAMLDLLRELEWSAGDGGRWSICPLCSEKITDGKHGNEVDYSVTERPETPCRLGALLDKHGRSQ